MRSLGYVEHETVTGETDGTAALSGPACPWRVADGIKGLQVIIQTGNQENGMGGLRGMYRAYKNGQYAFWDPDTVLGYPAAYTDLADRRDRGSCQIVVGIQDNLSFVAAAEGYRDDPEQACVDAKAVAEKVIQTLKGGA